MQRDTLHPLNDETIQTYLLIRNEKKFLADIIYAVQEKDSALLQSILSTSEATQQRIERAFSEIVMMDDVAMTTFFLQHSNLDIKKIKHFEEYGEYNPLVCVVGGYRSVEMLQLLIEKGCSVNTRDAKDNSLLFYVIFSSKDTAKKLDYLLQMKASFSAAGENCETPWHYAARNGNVISLMWLLEKDRKKVNTANQYGETPAHLAAKNGHTAALSLLADYGADFMIRDDDKYLAMHNAAERGHIASIKEIYQRTPETLRKKLFQCIASCNTPLACAVAGSGHPLEINTNFNKETEVDYVATVAFLLDNDKDIKLPQFKFMLEILINKINSKRHEKEERSKIIDLLQKAMCSEPSQKKKQHTPPPIVKKKKEIFNFTYSNITLRISPAETDMKLTLVNDHPHFKFEESHLAQLCDIFREYGVEFQGKISLDEKTTKSPLSSSAKNKKVKRGLVLPPKLHYGCLVSMNKELDKQDIKELSSVLRKKIAEFFPTETQRKKDDALKDDGSKAMRDVEKREREEKEQRKKEQEEMIREQNRDAHQRKLEMKKPPVNCRFVTEVKGEDKKEIKKGKNALKREEQKKRKQLADDRRNKKIISTKPTNGHIEKEKRNALLQQRFAELERERGQQDNIENTMTALLILIGELLAYNKKYLDNACFDMSAMQTFHRHLMLHGDQLSLAAVQQCVAALLQLRDDKLTKQQPFSLPAILWPDTQLVMADVDRLTLYTEKAKEIKNILDKLEKMPLPLYYRLAHLLLQLDADFASFTADFRRKFANLLLPGELILHNEDGNLNFAALQQRAMSGIEQVLRVADYAKKECDFAIVDNPSSLFAELADLPSLMNDEEELADMGSSTISTAEHFCLFLSSPKAQDESHIAYRVSVIEEISGILRNFVNHTHTLDEQIFCCQLINRSLNQKKDMRLYILSWSPLSDSVATGELLKEIADISPIEWTRGHYSVHAIAVARKVEAAATELLHDLTSRACSAKKTQA